MAATLGISLLVWVIVNMTHVAAHLLVARSMDVAVNRASLGVGPTLWSRTIGATTYRLALIPIAFVVRLRTPRTKSATEASPNDLRSKSRLVRLAVFSSAPVAVFLLGLVSAFWMSGFERTQPSDKPVVGNVRSGGPASQAGLQVGDAIVAIGGQRVETWADMKRMIAGSKDEILMLEIRRSAGSARLEIRPDTIPGTTNRVVGIGPEMIVQPPPKPVERVGKAVGVVKQWGEALVEGLSIISVGPKEPVTIAGPVAMYEAVASGDAAGTSERGFFTATIVTFGILQYFLLCLLLPYLDGCRLLFLGIEALRRKPLNPKYEEWFNRAWLGFFVVIAVLIIKNDISGAFLR